MNFEERLRKAVQRGQRQSDASAQQAQTEKLNEEDLKRLHSEYRLGLSEKIEECVQKLPNHFPGFRFETIYGERGWGAAVSRDDVEMGRGGGKRTNCYSRLEMTIRPFSDAHVLDLTGKGTVRNKEYFNRNHFEKLEEADTENFGELIDLWVLEYAELFAAKST